MWFITSIVARENTTERPVLMADCQRTFGYYKDESEAHEAIAENRCNMQECLYNYLVLENIDEGIHPEVISEEWFRWEDKWVPCEKPSEFLGIVNWGLG